MNIEVYAPFFVNGSWSWLRFTSDAPNTHAACFRKMNEIGATATDVSQSSTRIGDRVWGNPSVFL